MKWLAFASPLWVASGCAMLKPTRSGYLSDFAQVRAAPDKSPNTPEERPAAPGELAEVDSLYIEEVAWRSARPTKVANDPQLQGRVLTALRDALVNVTPKPRDYHPWARSVKAIPLPHAGFGAPGDEPDALEARAADC